MGYSDASLQQSTLSCCFQVFFGDLRNQRGEEAVQLARFLRQAVVWGILMIGSALALAAAAIQLALA
jgi:hypothetical protein